VGWHAGSGSARPGRGVRAFSGRDGTALPNFPSSLISAAASAGAAFLLGGKITCLDEAGRPDFSRLRSRIRARDSRTVQRVRQEAPATFMVFDVLHLDGHIARVESVIGHRRCLLRREWEDGAR
jgi:bifunctional non-homologous end joining protein LigD